jgi:1-phosphofructokinase/tagatose 6-phosphate kinase
MTVTLNAAVDKTLRVSNLQIGLRHRCAQGLVQPGGKGINVARALKTLGQPVLATGLAGGRNGTRIVEELTAAGILNDFVRITEESRTSTLLVDPALGTSTEIVEYGPSIAAHELETVTAKLQYLMRGVSTAVFAGSLPRDVPEDWYASALREARKARLQTVLDSEGEPLRIGLAGEPDLVAPNQAEAEELAGFEFQTPADFAAGLDRICDMGARNVIITHATGCAALVREPGRTHRLWAEIEPLEPVSEVGSGDALLAGYLAGRQANRPLEDVLRHAVGCGAANTQTVGAGSFDPRDATRLGATVVLKELDPPSE